MPRIDDDLLECVFFLYRSLEDAERGTASGGTGFFTAIPSKAAPDERHIYAVTNRHLIDDGYTVMRINTKGGGLDYRETDRFTWKSAFVDDLSVLPIRLDEHHEFRAVESDAYVTLEVIEDYKVGPGDDVVMVGRFINRDGVQQNSPSVRFGNISIMHREKMGDRRGRECENISVEMRSLGGYSGSPVFLLFDPMVSRGPTGLEPKRRIWLLGIDRGHVRVREDVLLGNSPHPDGLYILSNAGMANVIPAWRLQALLGIPKFALAREEKDKAIAERKNAAAAETRIRGPKV
jgi:hypothetical protein